MGKNRLEQLIKAVETGKPEARAKAAIKLARSMDIRGFPSILKALKDENVIVRRGAAEAMINCIHQIGKEELIAALKDDDAIVRSNAAYAMVNFHDQSVLDPLVKALEDKEPSVRAKAAFSIGRVPNNLGKKTAPTKVIEALSKHMKDKDPEVAYEASYSLLLLDDKRGYKGLLAQLDHNDKSVRWRSVAGMSMVQSPEILDELEKHLDDPDKAVRAILLRTIAEIGGDKVGPILVKVLKDPEPGNRVEALFALESSGYKGTREAAESMVNDGAEIVRSTALSILSRLHPAASIDELVKNLECTNLEIRFFAVVALLEMQDEKALGPLVKVLTNKENHRMWYSAEHRLEWLGDNITPFLISMLKDEDRDVRICATRGLGFMKDPSTVGAIHGALKDKDWEVRAEAAGALDRIHDGSSIEALIEGMKDPKEKVREACLRALQDFEEGVPVQVFLDALKDKAASVKVGAINRFCNVPEPRSLDALIRLLDDGDNEVIRSLGFAIGALKDPTCVPELIKRLSQEKGEMNDPVLRQTAALALGMIGDKRVVGPLVKAIKDPVQEVRREALRALAQIDQKVSFDEAVKALKDPFWEFRIDGVMTLMGLGDHKALKPLEEALRVEEHENVRFNIKDAISALGKKEG